MRISLREKRQITLPAELCEALGIGLGDSLVAQVEDGKLVITPSRKAVLDALTEISRALKEAGISEEELLESGKQIRKELAHETWPHLFPAVEKRD
jgi:AbrB family looped-hinge helix DNA binding protein